MDASLPAIDFGQLNKDTSTQFKLVAHDLTAFLTGLNLGLCASSYPSQAPLCRLVLLCVYVGGRPSVVSALPAFSFSLARSVLIFPWDRPSVSSLGELCQSR